MVATAPVRAQRAVRSRMPEPAAVAAPPAPTLASIPVAAPVAEPVPVTVNGPDAEALPQRAAVRQPFGVRRMKLAYETRPGYHRHWFDADPGRIEWAIECGWKHVQGKDGRNVVRIAGKGASGDGQSFHLMEIPLQWYEEDQKAKLAPRDQVDAEIRRGVVAGTGGAPLKPGDDGRYVEQRGSAGLVGNKVTATMMPDGRQFFGDKAASAKE